MPRPCREVTGGGAAGGDYVSPLELARVHVGLGEHDRALELLEQAAGIGASTTVMLNVEPAFDPLRREPRFRALVAALGL